MDFKIEDIEFTKEDTNLMNLANARYRELRGKISQLKEQLKNHESVLAYEMLQINILCQNIVRKHLIEELIKEPTLSIPEVPESFFDDKGNINLTPRTAENKVIAK
jgi:hypothetical protein